MVSPRYPQRSCFLQAIHSSLQSKAYEEIHIESSAVAFVQEFHETFLNQTFKYFYYIFGLKLFLPIFVYLNRLLYII